MTARPIVRVFRDGAVYLELHVERRDSRAPGWVTLHGYVECVRNSRFWPSWWERRSAYGREREDGTLEMLPSRPVRAHG